MTRDDSIDASLRSLLDDALPVPEHEEGYRRRVSALISRHGAARPAPWWRRPRGRTLAVLVAGAVLLCGTGTVYAAHILVGNERETPIAASSSAGEPAMIAFTSANGYWWSIVAISPGGAGVTRLAAPAGQPAWAPDGSKIAYTDGRYLWVANADGSGKRKVAKPVAVMPAWSPDGEQIVFVGGPSGLLLEVHGAELEEELMIVNADGSGLRAVLERGGVYGAYPIWARDGRIFFYTTTNGEGPAYPQRVPWTASICSVYADGSGLNLVTAVPTRTSFSLSPDGRWLLIWDSDSDRLIRLPASGQGMQVAVVEKLSALAPRGWRGSSTLSAVDSSWSQDGRWIVFSGVWTGRRHEVGGQWSGLYVVRPDGSGLRRVTIKTKDVYGLTLDPAWQPR